VTKDGKKVDLGVVCDPPGPIAPILGGGGKLPGGKGGGGRRPGVKPSAVPPRTRPPAKPPGIPTKPPPQVEPPAKPTPAKSPEKQAASPSKPAPPEKQTAVPAKPGPSNTQAGSPSKEGWPGQIKAAAEARQQVSPGQLKNFSPSETGRAAGHARSGHGWDVNHPTILDVRNNPDKIYVGINQNGNKVAVFWKNGNVVITDAADTTAVITAYGQSAPKRAKYVVDKWVNDPNFNEVK